MSPLKLVSGPSRLTALLALSLCFVGILVFNWRGPSSVILVEKLRAQSQGFLKTKKPEPRCLIAPHPGLPSTASLKKLWSDVVGVFDKFLPLLDFIEQQVPIKYDRIEPLLPTSATEATRIRSIHEGFIESIPTQPDGLFNGRGIVMVAGGSKSEYAATSLGMLRLTGSKLPIELWFVDKKVEKRGWCESMQPEGVTCRYISDYIPDASSSEVLPYEDQYTTTALLFSSFTEILYLHSDTIPVTNPDDIFSSDPYRETGLVAWPDFWGSSENPWALYTTGRIAEAIEQHPDHGTLDTAQLLIHKSTHWKTLLLTTYYIHYASFFQRFLSSTAPSARGLAASLYTSLAVLHAPFHHVPAGPDQIARSDAHGDKENGGSGVTVLHAAPGTNMPLLMHTSIARFGIRDLMCDATCVEDRASAAAHSERFGRPNARQRMIGDKVRTIGAIATRFDQFHDALLEGRRLLSWKQLEEKGLAGFEGMVWRVMERSACWERSPWREEGVCGNVGSFVAKAVEGFVPWREIC
ncbi:MAG: hypothetical protein LQ340_005888 [Diploschistes diacapsis]|nr:MAG: hypothetical protein LQ340_005888 [Diploschistes diacapsis]